jgi:hypothetical protein
MLASARGMRPECPAKPAGDGRRDGVTSATMANPPNAAELPPVEVVLSEVVASLSFMAHAYLTPQAGAAGADPNAAEQLKPELEAADIAIDVAGRAFERIQSRLKPEERASLARSLTSVRLMYVKERDR